jgi:type I restriction enzyme R subunit
LRDIAGEIADKVKRNATIDWTSCESAGAKLMILVRRTLTKHGYPPDKQQKAIDTVLRQAELLADCLFEHNYVVILKNRKNYGKIRLCLLDADE